MRVQCYAMQAIFPPPITPQFLHHTALRRAHAHKRLPGMESPAPASGHPCYNCTVEANFTSIKCFGLAIGPAGLPPAIFFT
eukprot:1145265-Pelagomonas_calceolata.AAC.1